MTEKKKLAAKAMPKKLPTYAIDEMPDALLARLGEVIARWGYLQFQVITILRLACKLDKPTSILLNQRAQLRSLCDTLGTVAKSEMWVTDPTTKAAIGRFAERVGKTKDVRNDYAHAVWGYGYDEVGFGRWVFDKSGGPVTIEEITVEGLTKDAEKARALWVEAQAITDVLKGRAKPSTLVTAVT